MLQKKASMVASTVYMTGLSYNRYSPPPVTALGFHIPAADFAGPATTSERQTRKTTTRF